MESRQSWKELAAIQIGGAICLPVILAGGYLAQNYGVPSAILALFLGNGFLLILSLLMLWQGGERGENTLENASRRLGRKGGKLFSALMLLSLSGWFAIQLNLMSLTLLDFLSWEKGRVLITLGFGSLITFTAMRGIRSLSFLSKATLPLMGLTLLYLIWNGQGGPKSPPTPLTFQGISLVIATSITAVIDLPTYFRFAKSRKEGAIALIVLYGIMVPFIEGVGVFLGTLYGGSLLDLFSGSGGVVWGIWTLLFLLLASWTTNNTNLYSSAVTLSQFRKKSAERGNIVVMGVVGTILASFDFLENFEESLNLIGVGIGSMGALILIISYAKISPSFPIVLGCWSVGFLLGLFTALGFWTLTRVPILDAFFGGGTALGSFVLYRKFLKKRRVCEKNSEE